MYSPRAAVAKRAIDLVAAGAGLVAAAPVLAVCAVLVKLSSPGPVLFRQQRVGRGGAPFELVKFRTMRTDAAGPQVTQRDDPRITRIGRLLRRTKLDELPELYNVLVGEMSVVGPRPEVSRYVELYPPEYRALIQAVRPGLTDPATVAFRNEEELLAAAAEPEQAYVEEILPRKLRMYRRYLESASLMGDVKVVLDTARVILFPATAPGPDRAPTNAGR